MNGYQMTLNGQDFVLRLNARGQKNLEDQYQKGAYAVLMEGIDLTGVRAAIFQQALNYPGNYNPVKDGYDFCDLLVDQGYAGPLNTADILLNLGLASGLLDREMEETLRRRMQSYVQEATKGAEQEHPEERPTTAKA